jgi:hypothetical protein
MVCPASWALEKTLPDTTSEFAERGTAWHAVAEKCLNDGTDAPEADRDVVQPYLDYVRAIPGTRLTEIKVYPLEDMTHTIWGTADTVIVDDSTLHVIDLKTGSGTPVHAEGNWQLVAYGLGALRAFDDTLGPFRQVTMHIVQPPLNIFEAWTLDVDALRVSSGDIRCAIEATLVESPRFVPDNYACKFCRAKAICTARAETSELALIAKFPAPDTLPIETLAAKLPMLALAKAWISDVEEHLLSEATKGTAIPGYKLVEGISKRKYGDQKAIIDTLCSTGLDINAISKPIELINLTDMEKLLGKKKFTELLGEYIVKPAGKPTLAPASDKRPAIAATALAFDDLTQ